MNGAQSLVQTLVKAGVDTCFVNPGTTELHLVSALAEEPGMRSILCLYENVCTGAADGYGRMLGKPAVTVLHLGPGLANGMANLHNANRACAPVLNIVGDHAAYHRQYDTPLTSDIMTLARSASSWARVSSDAKGLAGDVAMAVRASMEPPGQVATLVVPADCAWGAADDPVVTENVQLLKKAPLKKVPPDRLARVAEALGSGKPSGMLIAGRALHADALDIIGGIARATGAQVDFATFSARLERGAGRFAVTRLPYFPEQIEKRLAPLSHLVLVGARPPVSFFAYQHTASWLTPEQCKLHRLADSDEDVLEALEILADRLGVKKDSGPKAERVRPSKRTGRLTVESIGAAIGARLPENAIVSDEAVTSGGPVFSMTAGAPPHDWLFLTGGSMGQGLAVATGAAVACPDRKVICLHGDGGALYTVQSLWTQAREKLDVTTIIFSNGRYGILQTESARMGLDCSDTKAAALFDLTDPRIDWTKLAQGLGVHAFKAETAEAFDRYFEAAMAKRGPLLIEAVIR